MAGVTSNKVLAAGILGFVAGVLYAPRKGTETQAQLKEKLDQMKQEVASKTDKAKGKIQEMKSKKDATMSKVDQKVDEAAEILVP